MTTTLTAEITATVTGTSTSPTTASITMSTTATLTTTTDQPTKCLATINNFDFIKTIGKGSFGRVVLAQHRENKTYHAIKILLKRKVVKLHEVEHTLSEKSLLSSISFPFIVNLDSSFKDNSNLYMVLEYVPGGEMLMHLQRHGCFPESDAKFYTAQLVLALEYMHNLDLVYRDLKPENVLFDTKGYLKLVDFGFAKRVRGRTWSIVGTPEYLAPEIVLGHGYNKAVDWWSLGVMVYEMVTGRTPFRAIRRDQIYEKIVRGRVSYPPSMSPEIKSFLKKLLQVNQRLRMGNLVNGAQDAKDHKWMQHTDWAAILQRKKRAPLIPNLLGPGDTRHFPHYQEDTDIFITQSRSVYQKDFEDF